MTGALCRLPQYSAVLISRCRFLGGSTMCARFHMAGVLAVLLLAGCSGAHGGLSRTSGANSPSAIPHPQSEGTPRPFFDLRAREPNYVGPGREQAEPPDVAEVLIGYFGPPVASHPQAGDMWCAACLAIEQANESGGYRNQPFRLLPAWSDNPWGTGVKELTRLVFEDEVWAIIGGIDGPTTHLAEQVAVKAGLPLLNPVSTDKTVNLINVPWIFSCTPPDDIQAQVLAEGLLDGGWRMADGGWKDGTDSNPQSAIINPQSSFVLVSAVDHDSHLFAVEFEKAVRARRLTCAHSYQFNPNDHDTNDLVEKICSAGSDAVVIIAGAQASAQLVRRVRETSHAGSILGGPSMGQRAFAAEAGRCAEGVVFPCSYVVAPESSAFEKEFARRFGRSPDYLAARTYDAVNLLIAAIRHSRLNRARIRDALRELSPWQGVSGPIAWDSPGRNRRPVCLCTIADGQVVPLAPERRDGGPEAAEAARRPGVAARSSAAYRQ
jgi:branched-chain amino acid transport system substrate-binding protein